MLAEKVRDLGLDCLREKGTCPVAQDFCELVSDVSWLNQLMMLSLTRHIAPSVEKWRRQAPHDMPPFRFPPSPTFGDSSESGSICLSHVLPLVD